CVGGRSFAKFSFEDEGATPYKRPPGVLAQRLFFDCPTGFAVMAITLPSASRASAIGWRTPAVIVVCGCLISMISFGPRATLGFGLAGCSFSVVLAAFGKLLPERWRLLAFGAGTAAGSFGQFLYSPVAVSLMDAFGWQTALFVFGVGMLLVLPLSLALVTAPA